MGAAWEGRGHDVPPRFSKGMLVNIPATHVAHLLGWLRRRAARPLGLNTLPRGCSTPGGRVGLVARGVETSSPETKTTKRRTSASSSAAGRDPRGPLRSGNATGAGRRSREGWGVSALLVNSRRGPANWLAQRPGAQAGRARHSACSVARVSLRRGGEARGARGRPARPSPPREPLKNTPRYPGARCPLGPLPPPPQRWRRGVGAGPRGAKARAGLREAVPQTAAGLQGEQPLV